MNDDDSDYGVNDPDRTDPNLLDTIKKLEGLSMEDLLKRSQKKQLVDLLAKLEAGLISHQENAILRNLLRDNGMVMGAVPRPPEAGGMRETSGPSLPTYDDPEYEG